MTADGDAADVQWILHELEERFKCKSADMITNPITQDHLGMVIRVEGGRIYMPMVIGQVHPERLRDLKGRRRGIGACQPTHRHRQPRAVSQGQA